MLFQVTGFTECRDIANSGWVDLAALAASRRLAARLDNYRPFESDLWLLAGRRTASTSTAHDFTGPGRPVVSQRVYAASDTARLRADLAAAGPLPDAPLRMPYVELLHIRVNDDGQVEHFRIALGSEPAESLWIRATADLQNPRRARVCAGDSAE
jgi:hypothetical protein